MRCGRSCWCEINRETPPDCGKWPRTCIRVETAECEFNHGCSWRRVQLPWSLDSLCEGCPALRESTKEGCTLWGSFLLPSYGSLCLLCTPCPQPKGLETLACPVTRCKELGPGSPIPLLKWVDARSLPDRCKHLAFLQSEPGFPCSPSSLVPINLHCHVPLECGAHPQIPSVFRMEMITASAP